MKKNEQATEDATEKKPTGASLLQEHYIVGIGASAGGLEAIQELFDNIPADTDSSFIIVQHLSPDYKSLMAELLSKHTPMQVHEAKDGVRVDPNCVYVIPSKNTMTIRNGKIRLTEKKVAHVPNNAIDIFFESLAKEKGSRAVAVILSGTGTDGTKGAEAVKKAGGLVVVQDPVTARFDGMPNSAIISGNADLILSPELMPEEIFNHVKETPVMRSFSSMISKKDEATFTEILSLIHQHTSCDFTLYKRPTITRRITRRMAQHSISKLDQYLDFLHRHPEEIDILCKEFLIGVTKFFRDEEVFEMVGKKIVPAIIESKKDKEQVKIWVTACSTGEEAYTIAILFKEHLDRTGKDVSVKIFATDIDREAIGFASGGIYPDSIAKDISPELLDKYFIREGKKYIVHPDVRKMVIFAHHDITKDPPFSKMDMVSCRNMLIYMNPVLQKKILSIFVFALNYGGYLLLGSSETPGDSRTSFTEVSKKWKLYKSIATVKSLSHDTLQAHTIRPFTRAGLTSGTPGKGNGAGISEVFNDILGKEFGYAGILLDENYELKHATGNFNKYLSFPAKRLNFNVLKMMPEELAIALGTAVRRALKGNEKVLMRNIRVSDKKTSRSITMLVKPHHDNSAYNSRMLLVVLNDEKEAEDISARQEVFSREGYDKERLMDLELELKETKENLQAAVEELETSNEELQSSNEELLSANEELQSTNEELQSLNEELHTVNTEHQQKIRELIELNDDLNNYFKSTNIGQLFIDRSMVIRKFTPAAVSMVNLIDSDIGRPIEHISHNIRHPHFIEDIRNVIQSGEMIEKETESKDSRCYLMRIVPYVRRDKRTDGAVITFVDITAVKNLNTLLSGVLNSSLNSIMALNAVRDKGKIIDFEWIMANDEAVRTLGIPREVKGCRLLEIAPSTVAAGLFDKYIKVVESGKTLHMHEFHAESQQRWYEIVAVKLNDGLVVTFMDITDAKKAELKLQRAYNELVTSGDEMRQLNTELEERVKERTHELLLSEERFKLVSKATNDAVWDWNLENMEMWWNDGFMTLFGYKRENMPANMEEWYELIHPEDRERVQGNMERVVRSGQLKWSEEYRFRRADGSYAYIYDRGHVLQDENKKPLRVVGAMMDLSLLKEKEREQKRLVNMIENSTDMIGFMNLDGSIEYMNPSGLDITGLETIDKARSKKLQDLFNEKDLRFFTDHILAELKSKGHWEGEFQVHHFKTKTAVLVHFNIFATYDEDTGKVTGYGTVSRDIRRELAFRRAITEGAERLRLMANSMPQKIWTANANGMADYFNEQWMKYTGLPVNELLGDGWLKVVHPEDRKENIRLWKETVATGGSFQMERRLKRADGVYRWHLSRALAHRDESGNILGWVASSTDIDEQKKQEEKKDEFIGIASHELKTPLTSLKAYTQLVEMMTREKEPDIQKLQSYISKTATYIDRLNSLVSDLLDVSKIQSGKLTFNMQEFDLDEMLRESIEMLQHTNSHELILEGKTGVKVKGDKGRLEQVVQNLVSNAVKYSPKAKKVLIRLARDGDSGKVSITDYGIGIPPDKLDHLFNRFYRVEGMAHKFQGLGIGLYISSEIIKRHKGMIWVESQLEKGSTFHFMLPAATAAK